MENLYVKLAAYREMETERLRLRPVTLEDALLPVAASGREPESGYTFPTNQSLEETRNNIALFYLASPLGRWGIELKENGKFIGTIDLLDLDLRLKKGSIGYVLNKDYWNQGLATEATKTVIALAFEQIGMNKLIAVHDKDNPASGRVMAKAGMQFSHEEAYAMLDPHEEGRIVTRVQYVLTKEEYLAEK